MRISKSKKYAVEQFLIQKEIINLLNLEEGFYLYELDRDMRKQKQVMDMVPEIWRYFAHMNVTGLLYPDKCKRPWLSIVRGVLKNRYRLKYKACRYLSKNGSVFTMKYYVAKIILSKSSNDLTSTESLSCASEFDSYESDSGSSDTSSERGDSPSPKVTLKLKRKKGKIHLKLKYRMPEILSPKPIKASGNFNGLLDRDIYRPPSRCNYLEKNEFKGSQSQLTTVV